MTIAYPGGPCLIVPRKERALLERLGSRVQTKQQTRQ